MNDSLLGLMVRLMQMGVPREHLPRVVSSMLAQRGVAEDAMPWRNMLQNRGMNMNFGNPAWALPGTSIPNAHRGPLQMPGELPPQSPSVYHDWQTKI